MASYKDKVRAGENLKQKVKEHYEQKGKPKSDREIQSFVQQIQHKHDRKEK